MTRVMAFFFFDLQCLLVLLSFLFSIPLIKYSNQKIMKSFIIYTTIGLIVMIPLFLMSHSFYRISFADKLNNYSLVFGYSFLSVFLIKIMPDKKGQFLLWIIFFILLFVIIVDIFSNNSYSPIHSAFAFNHFGLIILSLVYLYKTFNNISDINILHLPGFWIVMGVFFCSTVSFPIYSLLDYFLKDSFLFKHSFLLSYVPTFSYSVMYLLFIKGFICAMQQKKIY